MIKLGLLGLGTVGQGVYEIIHAHKSDYFKEGTVSVKKVLVRNLSRKRDIDTHETTLTDQFNDILADDEITTIISVMGGYQPEYTYIKQALTHGKHVVTANKAVIATHIDELLHLAEEHNVSLLFEASVGGGIPIINSLTEMIKINTIDKILGILNGTTNFILSKMASEQADFSQILKQAQKQGFAEADPTADIEGYDVLRKIIILASMAFKTVIPEENVHLRGISNVTLDDIKMAEYYGYHIKYMGKAELTDEGYTLSVTPVLIYKNSVISNVNEEYNIVLVNGNIIGELCFMGKGAGKDATANAVVSDLLKILHDDVDYSHLKFDNAISSKGLKNIKNEYYIRITSENYQEFVKAINLISDVIKQNKIIYSKGNLYLLTEEIPSERMLKLQTDLKKITKDVFYARLEKKIL